MKTEEVNAPSVLGDDSLMTPRQAAKELILSAKTIERWRSLGKGPKFVQLGTSRVAYRLADIRQFIAERRAA